MDVVIVFFCLFVGACKTCKVERMLMDSCMQVGKRLTLGGNAVYACWFRTCKRYFVASFLQPFSVIV